MVERLGGPKLYTQRKGKHHRLIARHSPYDLNPRSAARWLEVNKQFYVCVAPTMILHNSQYGRIMRHGLISIVYGTTLFTWTRTKVVTALFLTHHLSLYLVPIM